MLDRTPRRRPDGAARGSSGGAACPARAPRHRAFAPSRAPDRAPASPRALAIGDRVIAPRGIVDASTGAEVFVTAFEALDAALLARHRPRVVLAGALSRGFDALDLALRLSELGFRGRLVILAGGLARPELVVRELAAACPALDVAVIAGAPTLRRRAPAPRSPERPRA